MSDGAHGTDYLTTQFRRTRRDGYPPNSVIEVALDLAKELAALKALVRELPPPQEYNEPADEYMCVYCHTWEDEPHRPDCLWLRLQAAANN